MQALVAIGWSQTRLAGLLGRSPQNMRPLMVGEFCQRDTADRVVALYRELWASPPLFASEHERAGSQRAKAHAARQGWAVPMAWDDIDTDAVPPPVTVRDRAAGQRTVDVVTIEAALRGERVKLSLAERRVLVARLHGERWSDPKIAAVIGSTDRTVLRLRRGLGLVAFDQNDLVDFHEAPTSGLLPPL